MKQHTTNTATRTLTRAADASEEGTARGSGRYVLRLFVSGLTDRSTRAVENVRQICEGHISGRYDLEVIDIHQQPELARQERIVAAPTLIRSLPLPLRRLIGDLSDTERVVVGLDLGNV